VSWPTDLAVTPQVFTAIRKVAATECVSVLDRFQALECLQGLGAIPAAEAVKRE
jgi:hypothetical protein